MSPAARRPIWQTVAKVIATTWAVVLAVALTVVVVDLWSGARAWQSASEHANASEFLSGRLQRDLQAARRHLARANNLIDHPLLTPVRALPFAGRQLRALSAQATAGVKMAEAGDFAIRETRAILDRPALLGIDKFLVVNELGTVAQRTEHQLRSVDLGPRKALIGPISRLRRELDERLVTLNERLRQGQAAARALTTLLEGPRRYLLFAANNAEMRAGSGMFLSIGELHTEGGKLRLEEMRPVTSVDIPPGSVPLEGDLRDRWGWLAPNDEWRNLMLSPRFDVQAPLAARMWEAGGHPPVDGVLALDPVFLEGLLRATGPVQVEQRQVSDKSVTHELLHRQYVRFTRDERDERREQLGRIARATFDALNSGRWSLAELARGIVRPVGGRHLLAWAADPGEQENWRMAGVDGSLGPESLLVAVLNRGGNKLDQFLRLSSDLAVARSGSDTVLTVRVTVVNRTPLGEPAYIAGPAPGTDAEEGTYIGILSVSLPGAAIDGHIEGVPDLAVAGVDGPTRVVGTPFQLRRDEERTFVVQFRLPGQRGSIRVEPSARVPPIRWTSGRLRWTDRTPRVLAWGEPV